MLTLLDEHGSMSSGTRAISIVLMGNELSTIIYDSRWLLLVITLCVAADFRYGWGESRKRYEHARRGGDKIVMSQYRWRTSRAVRRTMNKLIDYLMWVSLGVFTGMAVLKPVGIDYMMGGVAATAIAICCEAKSFFGHFFYLHGIRVEERSVKGFMKAFVVAFAKRKNPDVGKALEDAFEEKDTSNGPDGINQTRNK